MNNFILHTFFKTGFQLVIFITMKVFWAGWGVSKTTVIHDSLLFSLGCSCTHPSLKTGKTLYFEVEFCIVQSVVADMKLFVWCLLKAVKSNLN